MTDRERLIELIKQSTQKCDTTDCNRCKYWNTNDCGAARMADILIKNGVIVPPCKVGDELYCVYSPPYPANPADKGKWFMGEFEVARFHYGIKGLSIEMYGYGTVKESEIGKTVFLTREEAEKALAERSENDDSRRISQTD